MESKRAARRSQTITLVALKKTMKTTTNEIILNSMGNLKLLKS